MLRNLLLQELERRTLANPKYSLRAFARDLEIHSGTLSSIMNEHRIVGPKVLSHLLVKLPLPAIEKKRLFAELIAQPSGDSSSVILDEEVLSIVKDWEHYAILSYLQIRKAKHAPGDIAKALGLTQAQVLRAIQNLERTNLLKREGKSLKVTHKSLITTRGIPSPALREAHAQYIDKAKSALENFAPSERDITGITLPISHKNLNKAKELIQQFRSELSELLAQGDADSVYRLNIQLFPLTVQPTVEN